MTGILQNRLPFALGLLPGCGDDPRTLLVGPAARLGQQGVARLGGFAENPAALALGGSPDGLPLGIELPELPLRGTGLLQRPVDIRLALLDRPHDHRKTVPCQHDENHGERQRHPEENARFGL